MCIFGFAFCKSGTTFHSFRRVRVCVCLVGFASLQSPWAHTLKASLPCSLLPLHLILPSPTTIAKGQQPLSPHQHSCLLMNALLVLHPHYPLLCTTTLASLVKGRWIDGKAQTVALLHFACDTSTFLIYQTFCRQDGGIAQQPFAPHNLPKPHYPSRFS